MIYVLFLFHFLISNRSFHRIALILLLSCIYETVSITVDCKFSAHNEVKLRSRFVPDQIVCDAKVRSYENGKEFKMVSPDLTAIHAFKRPQNITNRLSHLLGLIGNTSIENVTTAMRINNHDFKTIPKGIGKALPDLEVVDFYDGDLGRISKNDLNQFSKANFFDFSKNKLMFLESDLFFYHPDIIYVGFYDNEILEIGGKFELAAFKSLLIIDLEKNRCIDDIADCEDYGEKCLQRLKEFDEEVFERCKPFYLPSIGKVEDQLAALNQEMPAAAENKMTQLIKDEVTAIESQLLQLKQETAEKVAAIDSKLTEHDQLIVRVYKILELALQTK